MANVQEVEQVWSEYIKIGFVLSCFHKDPVKHSGLTVPLVGVGSVNRTQVEHISMLGHTNSKPVSYINIMFINYFNDTSS